MSAVFRRPLGAALLAVEVPYRDGFESDALIPALLASVVSSSVCTSIFAESTLFAHATHHTFVPAHLPLYVVMAVVIARAVSAFLGMRHLVQRRSATWKLPRRVRPAIGGLSVGIFATLVVAWIGPRVGEKGQRSGILGGAFGHAARLSFHDPRIDPGMFALVGRGTSYGGIAHVSVGSLVMVCELAGSCELLVPLMLAEGSRSSRSAIARSTAPRCRAGASRRRRARSSISIATDWMRPAFGVGQRATLREAFEQMIELEVRELPLLDDWGHLVGLLDELEVPRTYLEGSSRTEQTAMRESGVEDEDTDRSRARRASRGRDADGSLRSCGPDSA